MAIYDDLANIIKGNRGDRLDMMIPLLVATVSSLANSRWGWIDTNPATVFFAVFGTAYAVWRIIAICVKKITGEWYRDRFFELLDAVPSNIIASTDKRSLRENVMHMRRLALAQGKSERRILAWARKLRNEDAAWDENAEEEGLEAAFLDLTTPEAMETPSADNERRS